ncbi:MAG: YwiC-like family protein [Elusimicrobia bacterium]|nr:YwiC-like family protein [Elusimicrobiota bacterium]
MMPKEHGSWAVLIAPILVGFAAAHGAPWGVALAFSAAALGGFLFRVPLQALASGKPTPGAWNWLVGDALLAAAGALPLFLVHGRWGLLGFAAPAGALLAYNLRANQQRETFSYANEILGIAGLCLGAPAAYYASRGTLAPEAWWTWLACALYFLGPIFDVKASALRHRAAVDKAVLPALARQRRLSASYHAAALAAVVVLALAGALPWLAGLPFAAALEKTLRRARLAPGRVDFKALGFAEVGYSVLFAAALGLGWLLRAP